jgi:electron transfer flavoprotein alpha/beta subunit
MPAIRILACFKMVSRAEDLTEEDWSLSPGPMEDYARPALSPEDESALELALRLGEALGAAPRALTIGGEKADRQALALLALGFSEVIRIEPLPEIDLRFRPEAIAFLISDYLFENPADLVIAGRRSADGQNALTPQLLAERLGWPLILEVRGLTAAGGPALITSVSSLDDALLTRMFKPPAVLAVGDAPEAFLRVPTLKARLAAKGKGATVVKADSSALPSPLISSPELFREPPSRQGRELVGTPREIALSLLRAAQGPAMEAAKEGGPGKGQNP